MRSKSSGHIRGRTAEDNSNFSPEVETSEVVMLALRNLESITDEHERGINHRSEVHACTEHRVFAQGERFFPPIADERKARLILVNVLAAQFDWLIEAIHAGWLQSIFL